MGLLDRWKDVLGLKKDKSKKEESKVELKKEQPVTIEPPIVQIKTEIKVINDRSSNRKKHRRLLLEEAKNGQN